MVKLKSIVATGVEPQNRPLSGQGEQPIKNSNTNCELLFTLANHSLSHHHYIVHQHKTQLLSSIDPRYLHLRDSVWYMKISPMLMSKTLPKYKDRGIFKRNTIFNPQSGITKNILLMINYSPNSTSMLMILYLQSLLCLHIWISKLGTSLRWLWYSWSLNKVWAGHINV